MTDSKEMPLLDPWFITFREAGNGPFDAPEIRHNVPILGGKIFFHPDPRFPDGEIISTSTLESVDLESMTAKCLSRRYKLGKIDPKWQEYLKENKYTVEQYLKKL